MVVRQLERQRSEAELRVAGRRVLALLERVADEQGSVDLTNSQLLLLTGSGRRSLEYGLAQARAAGAVGVTYRASDRRRILHLT